MGILRIVLKRIVPVTIMVAASLHGTAQHSIPSQTTTFDVGDGMQDKNLAIIKRIVSAYQRTAAKEEVRGDSMWQIFFDTRHQPLHNIVMQGNLERVSRLLSDPAASDLFYGFDNLAFSLRKAVNFVPSVHYETACLNSLMQFADKINLSSSKSSPCVSTALSDADSILSAIDAYLGVQVSIPNPYPGEWGLLTSRGVISERVPQALYQAWRIKQLVSGIKHPRILEIGAGLGRTAFYARQLGIEDYTIVDLPFTALSSGYFLLHSLGENQVLLAEETAANAQHRIKILTPKQFIAGTESYDLIMNADGFTELDPNTALAYWKRIERSTPIFLSINHECNQFTVKELIDHSAQILKSTRACYEMRPGYLEEVVYFKKGSP